MPMLDVSWVVQDPMFADTFQVDRREDRVGSNGRTAPTVVATFMDVVGTVTQQDPQMLMRKDDSQIIPRRIFIASTFAFRGASKDGPPLPVGYQPDLVTWNGTQYVVTEVLSYQRYGGGITEVICDSMTATDVPQ